MSWRRELTIAGVLLALGFVGLPLAIYAVGSRIVGDYAPDADFVDLALGVWSALAGGRWAAWLLVLSPYLVISLLRISKRLWRAA